MANKTVEIPGCVFNASMLHMFCRERDLCCLLGREMHTFLEKGGRRVCT